jgi:hypothetical protein
MAVVIKVKSRIGSSGAPSALKTGEVAVNHDDKILYVGLGNDGSGNATDIRGFAGEGLFALLASPTFTGTPAAPTASAGTNTTQLATTAFVQTAVNNAVQGLDPKQSVKAASTANLTLSGEQTVDGITLVAGDRILVKDQTAAEANGIYVVSASSWTRASDMDSWDEVPGAFVFVEQGTAGGDAGYVCTADSGGTLNTTAITWVKFTAVGAGDFTGPASSTDNAIVRFDGAGGKTAQNSIVTIADDGTIDGAIISGGTY